MKNERMTGAELATMRQACGLSRDELATLAGVQNRTLKHWESGHAGVPADVAGLVLDLLAKVRAEVSRQRQALIDAGRPSGGLVLIRCRTDADVRRFLPHLGAVPASVQGAIVGNLVQALAFTPGLQDIPVRVVWMDPAAYDGWRGDRADGEALRQAWAADAVQAQAMPHPGDQPV